MRRTQNEPTSCVAPPRRSTPRAFLRACRPHHWLKNLVVLTPVLAGHVYADMHRLRIAILVFCLMCLLSSAGYVLNDIVDRTSDRQHPTKRFRPFAANELNARTGAVTAIATICGVFAVAAFLPLKFLLLLGAYATLMLGYTFKLKQEPLIDVAVIATLFTLRVALGAAAIDIAQSAWLLSFAWSLFLSLSFAKRHCEIMHASRTGRSEIASRGYRNDDWPLTLSFGVGAGLASIVINLIYLANDAEPSGFYRSQGALYLIPGVVLLWLMRIWLLSHRTTLDDDPVLFAIKDPASIAMAAIGLIAFVLAL
jgi:4-hydroxybenzoate polyprenyltransferase